MRGLTFIILVGLLVGVNLMSLGIILIALGEICGVASIILGVIVLYLDKWIYLVVGKEEWDIYKNEKV